jgi:two-component system cell cycle sensor histidine kinase/response regulator CckA
MFTGTGNEEVAVAALKAGVDDYVLKTTRDFARLTASARLALDRVHERLRAEALELRLEDLLTRLNVGVCRTRLDGSILYVNPAFRRIFSLPPAPAQLPRLPDLIPSLRNQDFAELRDGHGHPWEARIESPPGKEAWISITQSMVLGPAHLDGVVDGVVAEAEPEKAEPLLDVLVEDITERKRREEIAQQLQRLEAIRRLAGGVAHDFNNTLTAINGYSEILLAAMDKDNPLRESLEQINLAGSRAARLTRELLAFGRNQMLMAREFDLNPFLSSLAPEIRRILGDAIRLDLEPGSRPLRVNCDPAQMENVVINIVQNARDAMPEGGMLAIRCQARQAAQGQRGADLNFPGFTGEGAYGVITLADTGRGMEPSVLTRIFEPFFTTKPKAKRTGMGLSAAYGIVKQSGGTITVDSAPGRGSRFEVWIPATTSGESASDPESNHAESARSNEDAA